MDPATLRKDSDFLIDFMSKKFLKILLKRNEYFKNVFHYKDIKKN